MASIDLIKASNGAGDAVQATVTSARVIGATTLKVNDVTNFPEGQFIGTTGTIDNTGVFDPATLTVFTAHLSGADVEIDTIAPGYADLGNTNGQVLVIKPNTLWADNVADTLAVSHNTDGTLKNKVATLSKINGGSTDGVLLTDASGNVTGGKVTADKIDFTTFDVGTVTTGTSTTVSLPAGSWSIIATVTVIDSKGSGGSFLYNTQWIGDKCYVAGYRNINENAVSFPLTFVNKIDSSGPYSSTFVADGSTTKADTVRWIATRLPKSN